MVANFLYGSGLRLMESPRLRVKDVVLERGELIVRDAKGGKDRVTVSIRSGCTCRNCTFDSNSRGRRVPRASRCRLRYCANFPMLQFNGVGSTYSLQIPIAWMFTAVRFAITCTRK